MCRVRGGGSATRGTGDCGNPEALIRAIPDFVFYCAVKRRGALICIKEVLRAMGDPLARKQS